MSEGSKITNLPTEERNFGLLRLGAVKKPKSEATVVYGYEELQDLSRMSHDRLVRIIKQGSTDEIRRLSRWFGQTNGIYSRAARYLSDLFRFDYILYPSLNLDEAIKKNKKKKILKRFNEVLDYFDKSSLQLLCRKWASNICLEGVYYGYICDDVREKLVIQDLPTGYCRSRFLHQGLPLVEFNTKYFDDKFRDDAMRAKILDLFPKEIRKAYYRLKSKGGSERWVLLDSDKAFKFDFNGGGNDLPPFVTGISSLLQLEEIQDIEKEKLLQSLQKVLVQQFELDKNGQLPFTMNELKELNVNAVEIMGEAIGVKVLSTVGKVHLEDLAQQTGVKPDTAVKVAENAVYNDFGISNNLFNTDGNIALEKSIATDQSFVKPMVLQFERFFNNLLEWRFKSKHGGFRIKILDTTIFNYKEVSKTYEGLTKIGFSRFLPMVSLGHTQKEVISLARLEQEIMELDLVMLPPFSSNTMSSETWQEVKSNIQDKKNGMGDIDGPNDEEGEPGRPPLPDDEKSEKTILNQESKQ